MNSYIIVCINENIVCVWILSKLLNGIVVILENGEWIIGWVFNVECMDDFINVGSCNDCIIVFVLIMC